MYFVCSSFLLTIPIKMDEAVRNAGVPRGNDNAQVCDFVASVSFSCMIETIC